MPTWKNWSGSVEAHPSRIVYPQSEADVIALVKECQAAGTKIRMVGSGHSFPPLAATDEVMVSLDKMQALVKADTENQRFTVQAGIKLKTLGQVLNDHGFAQENLGDIDVQSIAGAVSTGSHGTGAGLKSIATQVVGLRLVTADGEVHVCNADENPELFNAARVSLGALGIITEMTLRVMPSYTLDLTTEKMPLDEVLANIDTLKNENRHFEFFWIPHTNATLVKRMNITDAPPQKRSWFSKFNETFIENAALWLFCAIARAIPATSKPIAKMLTNLISDSHDITAAHETFASVRLVKFQEMEYSIPAEYMVPAFKALQQAIADDNIQVMFPVEARFVAADDIWLSPSYGRDSAYIAVHVFRGTDAKIQAQYFQRAEEIFLQYGGRPHWGKLNTRQAEHFSATYAHWDDFLALRQNLDPAGMFLNDYLCGVFGIEEA